MFPLLFDRPWSLDFLAIRGTEGVRFGGREPAYAGRTAFLSKSRRRNCWTTANPLQGPLSRSFPGGKQQLKGALSALSGNSGETSRVSAGRGKPPGTAHRDPIA